MYQFLTYLKKVVGSKVTTDNINGKHVSLECEICYPEEQVLQDEYTSSVKAINWTFRTSVYLLVLEQCDFQL